MRTLLIIMILISAFPAFSHAQAQPTNKPSIINGDKGTAQIIRQTEAILQEHQQAIELEKRETEKKLARLSPKKQKSAHANQEKLKTRLKTLEAMLKSIRRDKKILVATRNEYQAKFGSLVSVQERGKEFKKQSLAQRDIIAIEVSEPSKNAIMAEILNNKDDKRLTQLVNVLIDHTRTMDDSEKEYWRNLPPSIPFEHRFRLLGILATERQKLAALEKTCKSEVQQRSKHHLTEWEKFRSKPGSDKKGPSRKLKGHHP